MAGKRTMVCGVGVNDADSLTGWRVGGKMQTCPHYQRWVNMLKRCYDPAVQDKQPTYRGCTVNTEWLRFSNFKEWVSKQDWIGKVLDKDLLVDGNREYGPATCVLIDRTTNNFLTDHAAARGNFPIGVSWHKVSRKYSSHINNPFTKKQEHLGLFDSPEEAHSAWRSRKKFFAEALAEQQDDGRVAMRLRDLF